MSTARPSPALIPWIRLALSPLCRYHRYTVAGMEHIPRSGPALLCLHHSFATYDSFLLSLQIYEATGRLVTGLGDDLLFRLPGIREAVTELGIRAASPNAGLEVLREGGLLLVAPGGMREALRPRTERRRVHWEDRKGFARLALQAGVPLLLGACPAADDVFTVYESALTRKAYESLRLPLPLFRGLGPTLLPRPVPLVHHLAAPIQPPPLSEDPEEQERQIDALHDQALQVMQGLLSR